MSITLLKAWQELNDNMLFTWDDSRFLLAGRELPKGREFSYMTYHETIYGEQGFGLPETSMLLAKPERRVDLLRKRYVDPDLWAEALNRLDLKKKKLGGPMSYVFPFHRKDAPTGGGCLIGLVLTWFNKDWRVSVFSRASEVTYRLLGDMYFIQHMLHEITDAIPLKNWDYDHLPITWSAVLCSQLKHVMPAYLLMTRGEEFVYDLVTSATPESTNLRVWGMVEYFWDLIVHPERVSWAQRRRYSELFMKESTGYNWQAIEPVIKSPQNDEPVTPTIRRKLRCRK